MSNLINIQQAATPALLLQISEIYGNLFPLEIRYNLADFLESRLL